MVNMFAPKRQAYTWMREGSPEHRDFFSRFARAAYGTPVDIPTGYVLDSELSGKYQKVFFNRDSNDVIIANRGTVPTKWQDLAADAVLAMGITEQPRFRDSLRHARRTQDKYGPTATYTLTAHSLGGSISQYISAKTGMPAVTFSAHVPYSHGRKRAISNWLFRRARNSTNYSVLADPVSLFQTVFGETDYIVRQQGMDPHALTNFSDFRPTADAPWMERFDEEAAEEEAAEEAAAETDETATESNMQATYTT